MPLFSVLIPTYNRRERLLRALRSVLAQRFPDFETIVIDDGSTDGTVEALAGLGDKIRVIRQQNMGPSAARNAGARRAAGEYLAFLDSDDQWLPWTLERHAALLSEHARPTWLYGRAFVDVSETASGQVAEAPCVASRFDSYLDAAARDGVMPLPTGVAVRREAFLRASGFAVELCAAEDTDLWFRIGEEPGFVLMESPSVFVRELHEGSLGEELDRSFEGLCQVIRRERAGRYGGGREAAFVRRSILTTKLMYYCVKYARRGRPDLASRFYLEILRFQAEARFREAPFGGRRNNFLASFPVFLASPRLHAALTRSAFAASADPAPVTARPGLDRDPRAPARASQSEDLTKPRRGTRTDGLSMKKLSVVIATYNRLELLRGLLRDLAAQTIPPDDFEVIVVDDGSREPVRPALLTLCVPHELVVIEQKNAGAAAARHAGILRARAEIVVIVDDDMSDGPSFLAEHLRAHAAGSTLVLGHIALEAPQGTEKPLFERFHAQQLMGFLRGMRDGRIAPRGAYVCTGNVSFRRDAYLAVGGFDAALERAEDRELGVRLEKAGAKLGYCDAAKATNRSDHADVDAWRKRSYRDGIADARVARKHPDVEMIDPFRYLFEVNPVSRPLLLLAAMAPGAGRSLSRAAMRVAEGVDRLGLTRAAIAGATLVYGLDYFRGVREASGSLADTAKNLGAYLRKRQKARASSAQAIH